MNKIRRIEVTNVRYTHASRYIARSKNKLTQNKFRNSAGAGSESQQFINYTESVSSPIEDSGQTIETYGLPASTIYFDPATMTVDSVGSGRTVEETLTRDGDAFFPSLPVDYYRGVWFDGLEAYWTDHWVLSGDYVVPNSVLISGTEVIGRYVVV